MLHIVGPYPLCTVVCRKLSSVRWDLAQNCADHAVKQRTRSFFLDHPLHTVPRAFVIRVVFAFCLKLQSTFYKLYWRDHSWIYKSCETSGYKRLTKGEISLTFNIHHALWELIRCKNDRVDDWNSAKWRSHSFEKAKEPFLGDSSLHNAGHSYTWLHLHAHLNLAKRYQSVGKFTRKAGPRWHWQRRRHSHKTGPAEHQMPY